MEEIRGPMDEITLVMFADLHLDRQFAWASPAAASRRRQAIRRSLQHVVELADQVAADAILCGGDLYENELFTPDTAAFVSELFDCGRPVLIAPGNHDFYSPTSMYARTRWSPNVSIFTESRFRPVQIADGFTVWGAAHLAPTGTPGFFDTRPAVVDRSDQASGVHIALFHGSERSGLSQEGTGKVGHAPFDGSQIRDAGFDYGFVGHYHRAAVTASHCYPGNPDPLEFGESAGRGAVVAVVRADGSVTADHHSVAATACHSFEVDVTGANSTTDIVESIINALVPLDGFVRVDLVGTLAAHVELQVSDLRSSLPASATDHLDELVIRRAGLSRAYDLDELRSEDFSVRARFLDLVLSSPDLEPAEQDLVVELGLRAFDDRNDLEVV